MAMATTLTENALYKPVRPWLTFTREQPLEEENTLCACILALEETNVCLLAVLV